MFRKIILAFVAVFVTTFAQALTLAWDFSNGSSVDCITQPEQGSVNKGPFGSEVVYVSLFSAASDVAATISGNNLKMTDWTTSSITGVNLVAQGALSTGAYSYYSKGNWAPAEGETYYVVLFSDAQRDTDGSLYTKYIVGSSAYTSGGGWNDYTVEAGTIAPQFNDFKPTVGQFYGGVIAVPEPTSIALLALGIAALGLRRKV